MFMAILGVIPFFSPHESVQIADDIIRNKFLKIVSLFALILGLGSLLNHHYLKIRRKAKHWPYSWVLILSFLISAGIGILGNPELENPIIPTRIGSFQFDMTALYHGIIKPLGSTMFALLAFFMSSAAYRAFRAHNILAFLLLGSAFIVMMGQMPFGQHILGGFFGDVRQWMLDYPNVATKRGVAIGVALGVVATSLKIIFGIERGWLGGSKD
jgi:hypothetical protein